MRFTSLLSATALVSSLGFLVPQAAIAQSTDQWAGPYIGGEIGGDAALDVIKLSDFGTQTNNFSGLSSPSQINLSASSTSFSVVGGFNKQSGNFVYGLEADGTVTYANANAAGSAYTANSRLYGLLTLRSRLGLASGGTLVYGALGVSAGYGSFDVRTQITSSPNSTQNATAAGAIFGPTAAVGVEQKLNDNISLTAEGSVTSLGALAANGDNGKGPYKATDSKTDFALRGGLKYHF